MSAEGATDVKAPSGRLRTTAAEGWRAAPLGLAFAWALAVIAVDPRGDFPLNDDWVYALSVRSLLEEGVLWIRPWTSASLAAQVAWGALFSLPAGFSFTALRISTLALGLAGVLGTYGLLRAMGADRRGAFWGGLVVALNPVYLSLAFTFMTDVPFFALGVLSLGCYVRALRRDRLRDHLLGAAFAVLAVLVRQLGLAIPLAFGAAYLFAHGLRRRTVVLAALPVLIVGGALLAYGAALAATTGVPHHYATKASLLWSPGLEGLAAVARGSLKALLYAGLFALPFAGLAVPLGRLVPRGRTSVWVAMGVVAAVTAALALAGELLPADGTGHVLYNLGLGPRTLRDTYVLSVSRGPEAPAAVWVAVTAGAVIGAGLLLRAAVPVAVRTWKAIRDRGGRQRVAPALFLTSVAVLYAPTSVLAGFFDRYALFLLPPALGLLTTLDSLPRTRCGVRRRGAGRGWAFGTGAGLLALMGLFAIAATHDYLAWNRARWAALRHLTEDARVPPERIDGGYEYNGWRFYDAYGHGERGRTWGWGAQGDAYVVAFGPLPGYRTTDAFPFQRWLPPTSDALYVLEKQPGMEGQGVGNGE